MQYNQLQPLKTHVNRYLPLPYWRCQSGRRSNLHPWRTIMMTDADPGLIYLPMPNRDDERTNWRRTITSTRLRYHGPFRHRRNPSEARTTHLTLTDATTRVKTLELPTRSSRTAGGPNFLNSDWLTAPNVNTWLVEPITPLRAERSCRQCSCHIRKVPKIRLLWQPSNYFRLIFRSGKYYT